MLKRHFSPFDLVIFGGSLLLSVAVGVFHAIKAAKMKKTTTSEFLLGNRNMPTIPTAFSVLTSFLSGVLLLAVPAEVYLHGILMWIYMIAGVLSLISAALIFLPVIYRLKPVSVYEYFEHRFKSRVIRRLASSLFLLNSLFYMSIAIYAPAVALSSVTTIPTWVFIITVGIVCTFYTSVGGLKAVVWTDTLQAAFMFSGVLVLVIKGSMDSGGMGQVFNEVSVHGRLKPLTNVDPSPLQYFSLWIALFGGYGYWLSQYGINQVAMQRYCSLPTQNQACSVIAITTPIYFILVSLACLVGLVMFAFFNHCDPLQSGSVEKKDQLVIFMVLQSLGAIQGLPGLFLAALCSGTLSTLSSGINSLAAVTYEDFLRGYFNKCFSEDKNVYLTKFLTLSYGVLATGLAFSCEPLGGLLKAATSIMGTIAGPLAGLFALGVMVPQANKYGALFSVIVTEVFLLWICIGNVMYNPYGSYKLETFVDNCENMTHGAGLFGNNETANSNGIIYTAQRRVNSVYGDQSVFVLYRISNWLYCIMGIIMVVVIGTVISCFIAGKSSKRGSFDLDHEEPSKGVRSQNVLTIFDVFGFQHSGSRNAAEEIEFKGLSSVQ